jgi:predicted Zn-dependent protease
MKPLAILALLLSGPAFGSDISRGNQIDAIMRDTTPLYEDSDVCARVADIGQKIVTASGDKPGFAYSFYVLNSADVTAFSAPGGHVYVTTGLLRHLQSEDELAVVLGHEIAHVNEHHLMRTEMSVRTKKFWEIMLYAGSQAAAIYVGVLVQNAIGSSMNTYMPVGTTPGRTTSVQIGPLKTDRLIVQGAPTMKLMVVDNGGMQLAGLVSNAVSMGTCRGGALLLSTFYHGYKDEYEFEADKLAMQYANQAGYDGSSLIHVLERIGGTAPEIESTGISHLHSSSKVLIARTEAAKKLSPAK